MMPVCGLKHSVNKLWRDEVVKSLKKDQAFSGSIKAIRQYQGNDIWPMNVNFWERQVF